MGGIFAYTILGFVAAIITSQIMAIVYGTPVQTALEDSCKQSWYRPESFLGYHPLNHRTWFAMAHYQAMPPEALGKQRTLRIIVGLQTAVMVAAMVGALAMAWWPTN
ncbi:MAG: hypothetical protein KA153_10065 [Hyphomonadaceae bacterium]|nr:hypothetical protein [Hyphomonadaceae bacterium]